MDMCSSNPIVQGPTVFDPNSIIMTLRGGRIKQKRDGKNCGYRGILRSIRVWNPAINWACLFGSQH